MKPYYQDKYATIYHGDCLGLLPEMPKVDLVLTDPDYNAKDIGPNKRSYKSGMPALKEFDYDLFCEKRFQLCSNKTDNIAFTPGISNTHNYPKPKWQLCWHKPASVSFNRFGGYNAWEPIMLYGKFPGRFGQDYIKCNTLNFKKGFESGHPCPKPLSLWLWLIERCSKIGDTILDPFLGSGTTSLAAKEAGERRAIGIETEERYCEIAAKRLNQEVLDLA